MSEYKCIYSIYILYDHYMWWLKLKVCLQHRFPSREQFGHSTRLQILSNIWICIVSSHTSNAGIRGRKFFIFKDALTSGRLLRNVLEIFQLRKWRNNLTRWIDPLLVQEIFTLFHHEFVSSSVAFGASSSHGELGRFAADFFLELRCPTIQRQFHQPGKLTKTWPPTNNSFKQKDTCCRVVYYMPKSRHLQKKISYEVYSIGTFFLHSVPVSTLQNDGNLFVFHPTVLHNSIT